MTPSRTLFLACLLSFLGLFTLMGLPALAQDDLPPPVGSPSSSTYNETRITSLEEQLRAMNGRLEQLEYAIKRLDQTVQRMQSDNDARLTKLEQAPIAVPPPVAQPVIIPSTPATPPPAVSGPSSSSAAPIVDPNGTLGALKVQNGKVTGGVNNPQSPPLPNAPADYGLTPDEQYERAFGLLRAANYADAEIAFKSFIDKNPKDKLIDNAKYWYGETLYVRARFDDAAVAFADAYQQNPRGTKAPDSLLKLAMSLAALNKTPDACVTLNELKTKYPNATATIKARAEDERTRLKCQSAH